ncbi:MAG: TetR/AcrR family transcriptional regulator [Candidatus Promineifilaceae bacterium]|jgi:AcrR family transcriptional regulator
MPKLSPETIAARKQHILNAALTCFARNGYHQTTLDDIVKEAGVSKGGVYVHFDSKKELYMALFDCLMPEAGLAHNLEVGETTAHETLVTALTGLVAEISAPQFRQTARLLLDMWLQNLDDPEFKQMFADQYDQFRQSLISIIEDGIAKGEFKPVDAPSLANILLGAFDGLMVQDLIDETAVEWTAVSKTLTALVDGLLIKPH